MVDLGDYSLIDADIVGRVVFLSVVGMNCMGHICRNEEGTLDGPFETVYRGR